MAADDKTFDGDNIRQGVTGRHVRHVLAFGVAAVVLAFIFRRRRDLAGVIR